MPQTYSSGVPARGCEVSLKSLERCSRPATVTSEENEGSSMIGRLRRPHKRTIGRQPQKNYLWSRGGGLFGTETKRSALSQKSVLRTRVHLWLSPESFHLKHATDFPLCTHHTGIFRWQLSTWCPTPSPTTPLLPFFAFLRNRAQPT